MQFLPQLVGNSFRQPHEREALQSLKRGAELRLEREPENPFDSNAIRVMLDAEGVALHLGFIEAPVAVDLAPILDNQPGAVADGWDSEVLECVVFDLTNPKKPTLKIEVSTGWEIPTAINVGDEEDPDGYSADPEVDEED